MRRFIMGVAIAAASMIPSGAFAGDQETAQAVANSLKNSGRLKGYNIDVKAKEGAVILMGSVANDEQLAAAVDVANKTPGVQKVIVQLNVPQPNVTADGLRQPGSDVPYSGMQKPVQASAPTQRRGTQASNASYEAPPSHEPAAVAANVAAPKTLPSQQASPMRAAMNAQSNPAQQAPGRMMAAQSVVGNPPKSGVPPMASRPMPQQVAMNARQQFQPVAMQGGPMSGEPMPAYAPGMGGTMAPTQYDHAQMPNYAWPSYAAYPNYAALTYPKQYSATAWPFIGPFYPYPQVPLGWRKVTLEWDDGWWFLDFDDRGHHCHR